MAVIASFASPSGRRAFLLVFCTIVSRYCASGVIVLTSVRRSQCIS